MRMVSIISILVATVLTLSVSATTKNRTLLTFPLVPMNRPSFNRFTPQGLGFLTSPHPWYYGLTFAVGTPRRYVTGILDTGSRFTWFPLKDYEPTRSSTYKKLSCDDCYVVPDSVCSDETGCRFLVEYMDDSSASGIAGTDTFYLFDEEGFTMVFGIDIPDKGYNKGSDEGVIGLEDDPTGLFTALSVKQFSVCFPTDKEKGTFLRFGDDTRLVGKVAMLRWDTPRIIVIVRSIKVNYDNIIQDGDQCMFDTGASLSYFSSKWMDAILDELERLVPNVSSRYVDEDGDLMSELCYPKIALPPVNPIAISLKLDGGEVLVLNYNHLWYDQTINGAPFLCLGIRRNEKFDGNILGLMQMRGRNIGVDFGVRKLYLDDDDCGSP